MRSSSPSRGHVDLHLLLAERLLLVDGEHEVGAARAPSSTLLDGGGVHGVAVGEQHAAGEVLARAPQRVGVVPLQRLRVEHGLDRAARGAPAAPRRRSSIRSEANPVTTTASSSPTAAKLPSAMSRIVRSPSTGSSVFGSSAVSSPSRLPGPAASTIADHPGSGDHRRGRRGASADPGSLDHVRRVLVRDRRRAAEPPPATTVSASETAPSSPAQTKNAGRQRAEREQHQAMTSRPSQPAGESSATRAAPRPGGAAGRRGRSGGRRAPPAARTPPAGVDRRSRPSRRAPRTRRGAPAAARAQRKLARGQRPLEAPANTTARRSRRRPRPSDASPPPTAISAEQRAGAGEQQGQHRRPGCARPSARPSSSASGPSSR